MCDMASSILAHGFLFPPPTAPGRTVREKHWSQQSQVTPFYILPPPPAPPPAQAIAPAQALSGSTAPIPPPLSRLQPIQLLLLLLLQPQIKNTLYLLSCHPLPSPMSLLRSSCSCHSCSSCASCSWPGDPGDTPDPELELEESFLLSVLSPCSLGLHRGVTLSATTLFRLCTETTYLLRFWS